MRTCSKRTRTLRSSPGTPRWRSSGPPAATAPWPASRRSPSSAAFRSSSVPYGTRNHFARDLGLDREDPLAALAGFEGEERRVDVGRAGERRFLNNVSLGLYASLVHRREHHRRRRQALAGLRALWLSLRRRPGIWATIDGEPVKARVVLVANNAYRAEPVLDRRARATRRGPAPPLRGEGVAAERLGRAQRRALHDRRAAREAPGRGGRRAGGARNAARAVGRARGATRARAARARLRGRAARSRTRARPAAEARPLRTTAARRRRLQPGAHRRCTRAVQ